jgi:hypothetical protein
MTWKLSRFRAGDLVEVRSREEILAGLDAQGRLDGMPFMPEMLQSCGQRFRVRAVAHKTCDTAKKTSMGRRLDAAVHLEGSFCDGSAHGGCEAQCTLFWKDAWLKRVDERDDRASRAGGAACSEADLAAHTRRGDAPEGEIRYACQATELYDYTAPLQPWDLRQYLRDVTTLNHSAGHVVRVLFLAWLRWILDRLPFGYRAFKVFHDWAHLALSGRPSPALDKHLKAGERTPTGRLDLAAGECVRIKAQSEIEPTLDPTGKNRGLSFDPFEMAPYCGREFKVRKTVTRIIDEPTGRMIDMKQPCIMLEGVVCHAEYADCRLNCPRAIPSYWRELWLERIVPTSGEGKA